MPDSVITSCPSKVSREIAHHSIMTSHNHVDLHHPIHDDGGSQTDSSNSNSSLASSPRYNERHPRVLRKKSSGRVYYGSGSCWAGNPTGGASTRGSFAMLGSRTSLPPLDENNPLDATESQLALNLRRATRSTSWTNQKILDTIDGLSTCAQELDPCLALGMRASSTAEEEKDDGTSKNGSPRQSSFEKFVLPKSISNLIMKSRSSGSVNPPTSNQNRENSCYNFLSGIREDEDEEQQLQQEDYHFHHPSNGRHSTYSPGSCSCTGGGTRLTMITSVSIPAVGPPDEIKRKRCDAGGGESILKREQQREGNNDDLVPPSPNDVDKIGTQQQLNSKIGNVNRIDMGRKTGILHQHHHPQHHEQNRDFSEPVISSVSDGPSITEMASSSKRNHHQQQPNHNEHGSNGPIQGKGKGEQQKLADVHHQRPHNQHPHPPPPSS